MTRGRQSPPRVPTPAVGQRAPRGVGVTVRTPRTRLRAPPGDLQEQPRPRLSRVPKGRQTTTPQRQAESPPGSGQGWSGRRAGERRRAGPAGARRDRPARTPGRRPAQGTRGSWAPLLPGLAATPVPAARARGPAPAAALVPTHLPRPPPGPKLGPPFRRQPRGGLRPPQARIRSTRRGR